MVMVMVMVIVRVRVLVIVIVIVIENDRYTKYITARTENRPLAHFN